MTRLSSQPISRREMLALLLATPALLAACAQGAAQAALPEIRYGQDLCAECGMIISDPRFAAGLAYEIEPGRYQSLAFDDIGELLTYAAKHSALKIVGWYVHDYESQEWLDASGAFYVLDDELQTPMGFGIAAHAERDAAEAMAVGSNASVMTWDELRAHFSR